MTSLRELLTYIRTVTANRDSSENQYDKGISFEHLMVHYFQTEPYYRDQYRTVLRYGQWAEQYREKYGLPTKSDAGIDLVATTYDGEHHAIQCKNFAENYKVRKEDIDSFFTASGKTWFQQRIIVATTNQWTNHAEDALTHQQPPVSLIKLADLEQSVIDWSNYQSHEPIRCRTQKILRAHQEKALQRVIHGFSNHDRGKLIMACGTGKTYTALNIAENCAGAGKRVLFLIPSLALLGQTVTEWTQDTTLALHNFAVCSDSDIGKKRDDDRVINGLSDLQYPATTNAGVLFRKISTLHDHQHMSVVYATYHSIDVIHQAQQQGLPEFDLIICDEAHRTTGATFDGEDESAFVRIHDNNYIRGKKRLYMTATPRIYGDVAKAVEGVTLCSMDDESLYGPEFSVLTFSEAVSQKLLVDYKVVVLAVEEAHIKRRLQKLLSDGTHQIKVDDAAKIIGCWKALSKYGFSEGSACRPMQRAVAFCQVIEASYKGTRHKVSSKLIAEMFAAVVHDYQESEYAWLRENEPDIALPPQLDLQCEVEHVDGSMNAGEKEAKLSWLKAKAGLPENTCRILSNVRCLSEGVDVPALDAVLFLTPKNSQVDVVQSVGRVMRLSPDKELGYVILPVVIPAGVAPEEALDNNESYRIVWQVLNALRAHDDRFDAMINKLEFNGSDTQKMEVIAIAEKVGRKPKPKPPKPIKKAHNTNNMIGGNGGATGSSDTLPPPEQLPLQFEIGEIERALYAKIVKKCGNRHHWEDWAGDIAKIANTHIDRIQAILHNPDNTAEKTAFKAFTAELRDDLNQSVTDDEIVEMLAQHLITKPVFDALFEQYRFTAHNPMSRAMQHVLDILQESTTSTKNATPCNLSTNRYKCAPPALKPPQANKKSSSNCTTNFSATLSQI